MVTCWRLMVTVSDSSKRYRTLRLTGYTDAQKPHKVHVVRSRVDVDGKWRPLCNHGRPSRYQGNPARRVVPVVSEELYAFEEARALATCQFCHTMTWSKLHFAERLVGPGYRGRR